MASSYFEIVSEVKWALYKFKKCIFSKNIWYIVRDCLDPMQKTDHLCNLNLIPRKQISVVIRRSSKKWVHFFRVLQEWYYQNFSQQQHIVSESSERKFSSMLELVRSLLSSPQEKLSCSSNPEIVFSKVNGIIKRKNWIPEKIAKNKFNRLSSAIQIRKI